MIEQLINGFKNSLDVLAGGVLIGVLVHLLTPLAAFLTCFWMGIRIYEYYRHDRIGD